MSSSPRLREATAADLDRVFEWLNDPVTRAMSLSTAPVPYADHCAWFEAALRRPTRHLFIAEHAGEAVGFLRLDANAEGAGCTISINLAPQARGRGLGRASLEAATEAARGLDFSHIDALIRAHNGASLAAFARAGYRPVDGARVGEGVLAYRLELGA